MSTTCFQQLSIPLVQDMHKFSDMFTGIHVTKWPSLVDFLPGRNITSKILQMINVEDLWCSPRQSSQWQLERE